MSGMLAPRCDLLRFVDIVNNLTDTLDTNFWWKLDYQVDRLDKEDACRAYGSCLV